MRFAYALSQKIEEVEKRRIRHTIRIALSIRCVIGLRCRRNWKCPNFSRTAQAYALTLEGQGHYVLHFGRHISYGMVKLRLFDIYTLADIFRTVWLNSAYLTSRSSIFQSLCFFSSGIVLKKFSFPLSFQQDWMHPKLSLFPHHTQCH
jgi:hypothetical protein